MNVNEEKVVALRAIIAEAERLLPPGYAAYVTIVQTDSEKWMSDLDIGAATAPHDLQTLVKLEIALRDMRSSLKREIRNWRAAIAAGETPPPPPPKLRLV